MNSGASSHSASSEHRRVRFMCANRRCVKSLDVSKLNRELLLVALLLARGVHA